MKKTSCIFLIMLLTAYASFAVDVPYLSGRVNDYAEVLSSQTRSSVSEKLLMHEKKTGNQVVVLTISTLEGESIEEYADRVFQFWKLGQKGKDNGVLLIIATQDRRMRIEVGYGLEPVLTDLISGRIIRNIIAPRFKAGDYDGGVEAGVSAILQVLETGASVDMKEEVPQARRSFDIQRPDMPIATRILVGAFVFGIIGLFTVIGVLTPGIGWFLYFFLIPFWAAFPMIVVNSDVGLGLLIAYLIGYPAVKLSIRNKEWYKKAKEDMKRKGHASIGGFVFTSGGGGGWSSGGGFSGGGGSSGGGGASGGW